MSIDQMLEFIRNETPDARFGTAEFFRRQLFGALGDVPLNDTQRQAIDKLAAALQQEWRPHRPELLDLLATMG